MVAEIVESVPPAVDLLLPGTKKVLLAQTLRAYEADLVVCYGFPWKFPLAALRATTSGAINVHTSMLPKYRGPIPVNWAIRNGDREIGVTVHRMNEEFDSGEILVQESGIVLDDDVVPDRLWGEVDRYIERLLPVALAHVERGVSGMAQREDQASYAGWMEPEFSYVDWGRTRNEIHNQVRATRFGSSGKSGPIAKLSGKQVRVLRTALEPTGGRRAMCADGPLWIVESTAV